MGSLTSRPRVSTGTTTVITAPQETTETITEQTPQTETDNTDTQDAARSFSLLSRDRGRFGTILTSFRGLLGSANKDDKRKTLLGE